MDVKAVLFNILMQLIYFVGVVFLFGYVISVINKQFYVLVGRGRGVCYATGIIGTPIHELSHAVMCVVFMHKIDEIRLFQVDRQSGTLGYVKHSFNKKSPYQQLGNYFIGTAPIVVGTLVVFLLVKWIIPEAFGEINFYIDEFSKAQSQGAADIFSSAVDSTLGIVGAIFSTISIGFPWWCFIILAMCISLHMNLSSLDIKGAVGALPILVALVAVLNFVMSFVFSEAYPYYVSFMNEAGAYLAAALLLSLALSLVSFAIAFLIRLFVWLPSRFLRF